MIGQHPSHVSERRVFRILVPENSRAAPRLPAKFTNGSSVSIRARMENQKQETGNRKFRPPDLDESAMSPRLFTMKGMKVMKTGVERFLSCVFLFFSS